MADQHWTMRVLAGVHVGAEVTLPDEDNVLGSDESCDFVFDDAGVAQRHLSLRPTANGVQLTVLDANEPVLVDGHPVEGSTDLEPYRVVSCGALALAVGPTDAPWPSIDLPGSRIPDADTTPPQGPAEEPVAQPGDDPGPRPDPPTAADAPARRNKGLLAAVAGFAGIFVVGLGWLLVPREVQREPGNHAEVTQQIRQIAARHGARIEIDVREDAVHVTGLVDTQQTRSHLLQDLANASIRAAVQITSTEAIAAYAASVLDQSLNLEKENAVEVTPTKGALGELLVSGYVRDPASLARTRDILERDITEAVSFSYRVQSRDDRLTVLRRRLDALGLAERLHIQQFPDRVGLFGPVASTDELSAIRELVERYNEEFESRPELVLSGTDSFLGESTIDLDVRAVVLGENVHVVLHDGASYGHGSKVAEGHVIRHITPRYMILERAEHELADSSSDPQVAFLIFQGL